MRLKSLYAAFAACLLSLLLDATVHSPQLTIDRVRFTDKPFKPIVSAVALPADLAQPETHLAIVAAPAPVAPVESPPVPVAAPATAPLAPVAAPVPQPVVAAAPTTHEALMAAAGISPANYPYVDYIVSHESGWRVDAYNPSGAYGLCQALPASKMGSAGADYLTNPVTQLMWCAQYAAAAHGGGWYNCYLFWQKNLWW